MVTGSAIGAGSFGCCFPVRDTVTQERFCLKVPRLDPDEDMPQDPLHKEVLVLQRFNHVNIVRAIARAAAGRGNLRGMLMPLGQGNLWQWLKDRCLAGLWPESISSA